MLTRTQSQFPLAQTQSGLFLTDGGLETTLIFHEGWELPLFASFPLVETPVGRAALKAYYDRYLGLAVKAERGFLLETPTWRATPDWGAKLGYDLPRLAEANRACIALIREYRDAHRTDTTPVVISGCIGPRGDGYKPGALMSAQEAEAYHGWQVRVLSDSGADIVSIYTMNYIDEALGFARAAQAASTASVVSFTVETDGRLPSGETLGDAIHAVDDATGGAPLYYMINCDHLDHFRHVLDAGADWTGRLGGLRANSYRKSHAELDESTECDIGNPEELGQQYAEILKALPNIRVIGGCCGTDHRHVAAISNACTGHS
jgi:homocysteine S-methyltransferase